MNINIVGQSYPSRAYVISANRLVNMYAQKETADAKSPASLLRVPGLKTLIDSGIDAPVRGAWTASNGASFAVIGNKLCRLSPSAVVQQWTLDSSQGYVTFRDNGLQLLLVDGVSGYTVTLATNTFAKITDPDFPNGARDITYIDTYFIAAQAGSQQFFISGQMDGTSWGALDFFAAEGNPDILRGMIENHRELWLFGARTTEVWGSTTDANFPFQRVSFVEQGCASAGSVAKLDNSVFWLSSNDQGQGIVYRANGYSPQRISTHAIEYEISKYQRIDDALALTYVMEGHSFYVLTFPSEGKTWVYDAATGLWHERAGFEDGEFSPWPASAHLMINNMHVVGDYQTGKLYEMSSAYFDNDGQEMLCLRSVRVRANEMKPISFGRLVLDAELGVGLTTGQGSDPTVTLKLSDDGGRTYHTTRQIKLGKIGETNVRAECWGLGQARDRVFELTISDPVEFVIVGAYIEAKANG